MDFEEDMTSHTIETQIGWKKLHNVLLNNDDGYSNMVHTLKSQDYKW